MLKEMKGAQLDTMNVRMNDIRVDELPRRGGGVGDGGEYCKAGEYLHAPCNGLYSIDQ